MPNSCGMLIRISKNYWKINIYAATVRQIKKWKLFGIFCLTIEKKIEKEKGPDLMQYASYYYTDDFFAKTAQILKNAKEKCKDSNK